MTGRRCSVRFFALAVIFATATSCAPGLDEEALLDPESCAGCHPVHYDQWRGSMHAYTGVDPIFDAMNKVFQEDDGGENPEYCVSCHSPMALKEGATTDGTDLDELPDHLKGITCATCHLIDSVPRDHNAGQVIADDGIMRGGIMDPVRTPAHKSMYSLQHDRYDPSSNQLCGACHCVFTPDEVHVERTFREFRDTVFATHDLTRLTCSRCHMHGYQGRAAADPDLPVRQLHDHSWPGVDVALLDDFPGRDVQMEKIQEELDRSLQASLCVDPDPAGVAIGVTLENVGAGHSFPSGSVTDRRVWVELRAWRDGEEILSLGVVDDTTPITDAMDGWPWIIRGQPRDADGEPVPWMWEAVTMDSNLLLGAESLDPTDPAYWHAQERWWPIYTGIPDRVTMRVRMRATALETFAELAARTDFDASLALNQPTFTLNNTVLEWTGGLEALGTCVN